MIKERTEMAKRIKNRRKELGLTREEVADYIGRAIHYYGDIERGTCGMSIDTLMDLAECLDLSVDYILYGNEGENCTNAIKSAYRILRKYDEKTQRSALDLMKFYLELRNRGN